MSGLDGQEQELLLLAINSLESAFWGDGGLATDVFENFDSSELVLAFGLFSGVLLDVLGQASGQSPVEVLAELRSNISGL